MVNGNPFQRSRLTGHLALEIEGVPEVWVICFKFFWSRSRRAGYPPGGRVPSKDLEHLRNVCQAGGLNAKTGDSLNDQGKDVWIFQVLFDSARWRTVGEALPEYEEVDFTLQGPALGSGTCGSCAGWAWTSSNTASYG